MAAKNLFLRKQLACVHVVMVLVALIVVDVLVWSDGALAQQGQAGGEVQVVPSPLGSGPEDTTYEIRLAKCRVRWTVARSGVNEGVAQHRTDCLLPLDAQMAVQAKILDVVLVKEPTFRTLFLGRLTPFPELSVRLALEAQRSSGWDTARGQPKPPKTTDRYLLEMLSAGESTVFSEWRRLFEERRLSFAVSGVEEVSIGAAGVLPFFQQLSAQGVSSGDRVPFDGLIWFSASRRK